MTSAEAALALCRFTGDAAVLSLWGAWAYLAWLVPADLAAMVGRGLRRPTALAVAAAVLAATAKLPAVAASIGDGWGDAADPGLVARILAETGPGHAWAGQAAAALLLVAARRAPARLRPGATALAAGLSVAGLAATGHAAMHEGALGLLHRSNDALHALAAGAWFGALVPVLAILREAERPGRRASAGLALRRFSRAGHIAVALTLASGIANAALVLGRWPGPATSPYAALLDLKALAVAGMVTLALINRYALVPRLGRPDPASAAMLRRTTLAEIMLGLAALASVSAFGLLDPD